jgi:hypothetical protein
MRMPRDEPIVAAPTVGLIHNVGKDPIQAARIISESRCSHGAHAEHFVSNFRCYKLFALDLAFLHIHHKYEDSAECCTENHACQRC